ncbi:MAG: hypothetical protein GXO97_09200 [Nitrospirae bacterium]|nr:hypothetical protein [Nitrospirota bacterium]
MAVLVIAPAYAGSGSRAVTPYGDFCPMASKYGMHRHNISIEEAKAALSEYYKEKGLNIWIVEIRGRFIKLNVTDGKKIVDTVIFDRHTGRLRSIY